MGVGVGVGVGVKKGTQKRGRKKGDAKKGTQKGLYIVHCKYIQTSLSSGLGCIPNTSKKKYNIYNYLH